MRIYLDDPIIGEREARLAAHAVRLGKDGMKFIRKFEEECAKYLGVEDCLATSSGTAALHLGLFVNAPLERKVVVPTCTFVATANVLKYMNYEVLLTDVDKLTWTLNSLGSYGACIPVDLYGNYCGADEAVVYDAAESFGMDNSRKYALNAYSFNNNKTATTFGGGLLTGSKEEIAEARRLAYQCRIDSEEGFHNGIGFNYRMSHLSAAIGLAQLYRLPKIIEKKRRFNQIYREELSGCMKFQESTTGKSDGSSWWFTAGIFETEQIANVVRRRLYKSEIPYRRVFYPLHWMEPYKTEQSFPVAEKLFKQGLCLPSSPKNGEREILHVCQKIKNILRT